MQIFLLVVAVIHIAASGYHLHLAAWWHERAQYRTMAYIGGRNASRRNINIMAALVNAIVAGGWVWYTATL